jgi:hypothetical protein
MMRSLNTALYLILNGMIRIPFYVRLSGLPSSFTNKEKWPLCGFCGPGTYPTNEQL